MTLRPGAQWEEMQGPRQVRPELEQDGAREGRKGRWEGCSEAEWGLC